MKKKPCRAKPAWLFLPGGPGRYRSFAVNGLLARRLVERGVRFVNLQHSSWDHCSNLDVELPFCYGMADQPIAALLQDPNTSYRDHRPAQLAACQRFGEEPWKLALTLAFDRNVPHETSPAEGPSDDTYI